MIPDGDDESAPAAPAQAPEAPPGADTPARLDAVLSHTQALLSAAPPAVQRRRAIESRRLAARDLSQKMIDRGVPQSLWTTTLAPQIAVTAAVYHLRNAWRWRRQRAVKIPGGAFRAPACTVVLSGIAGSGKDTAAAYPVPRLISAHFALVSDIASLVDSSYSDPTETRKARADRERLYRSVDYLAISDVGREESRNGRALQRLVELLQDRIDADKMTVLTMQLDNQEFLGKYIPAKREPLLYERMMSRLDHAQMGQGKQPWFLRLQPGPRVADFRRMETASQLAAMPTCEWPW